MTDKISLDEIALYAMHKIEALQGLNEVQRKARIQLIVFAAITRAQQTLPRWRHLKRGNEYIEIGRGFAQCSWAPIEEMTCVVIYQGLDDRLWVRNAVEFDDGRFEPIL